MDREAAIKAIEDIIFNDKIPWEVKAEKIHADVIDTILADLMAQYERLMYVDSDVSH